MQRKFYRTDSFIKLQNKWYKKLNEQGFEDLEFYNPKTGAGQNATLISTKTNLSVDKLIKNYAYSTLQSFRIAQIFLSQGDFLRQKPRKNSKLHKNYSLYHLKLSNPLQPLQTLAASEGLSHLFTHTEYELFKLYCEGLTVREISAQMRELYKLKKVHSDAKLTKRGPNGEPFSVFWVSNRLRYLISESRRFFQTLEADSPNPYQNSPENMFISLEDNQVANNLRKPAQAAQAAQAAQVEETANNPRHTNQAAQAEKAHKGGRGTVDWKKGGRE